MLLFDSLLTILSAMLDGFGAMYDLFSSSFRSVVVPLVSQLPWLGDVLGSAISQSWLGEQSFLVITVGSGLIVVIVIKVVKGLFI